MESKNRRRSIIYYIVLLTAGFAAMTVSGLLVVKWGSGLATAIWFFAFLELACRYPRGRRLAVTAAVFCVSYSLRFITATDVIWLNLTASILTALAMFAIFLLYARLIEKRESFIMTLVFPLLWTAYTFWQH